jgi:hypothetical protein
MWRVPFGVDKILISAVLLLASETAAAGSLCLTEDSGSRPGASADAPSSSIEFSEVSSVLGGTQGYLSFNGSTSYVYGHFSGCGERFRFSPTEGLKVSYSTVKGVDPFERLRGRSRDAESFFDAEFSSTIENVGSVGYTVSSHTATVSGAEDADAVRGGRLWFGTPDERFKLSSELAMSETQSRERIGTAQRHQMSLVLMKTEQVDLSTNFYYSNVARDFRGRRSTALSDREAVGATANLQAGNAAFSARFSQSHNNLDGLNDKTHYWRVIDTEASYALEDRFVLPDRIRAYATQFDEWETPRDEHNAGRGRDMKRRLGLAATWAQRRWHSRFSFGRSWEEWLGHGIEPQGDGTFNFGGTLFANWTTEGVPEDRGFLGGGDAWLSLDLSEFGPVPGRVETRALVTNGTVFSSNLGWRWDVTAEIDGLDLLFDRPSGGATYMVGRLGSTVREDETCFSVDYRSMLVAGFRF